MCTRPCAHLLGPTGASGTIRFCLSNPYCSVTPRVGGMTLQVKANPHIFYVRSDFWRATNTARFLDARCSKMLPHDTIVLDPPAQPDQTGPASTRVGTPGGTQPCLRSELEITRRHRGLNQLRARSWALYRGQRSLPITRAAPVRAVRIVIRCSKLDFRVRLIGRCHIGGSPRYRGIRDHVTGRGKDLVLDVE